MQYMKTIFIHLLKFFLDSPIPANKILCNSSCLQYFHAKLGIK